MLVTARCEAGRRRLVASLFALVLGCSDRASVATPRASASPLRPRQAQNHAAAITSRVDQIAPGGALGLDLTGEGVLLGEWDQGGVRESHVDLRGRVTGLDAAGAADHSTHVAGTIAGNGSGQGAALGMAPKARVLAFDWAFDRAELRQWAPYLLASNHAYGFRMGWGNNPACADQPSWLGRGDEREDRAFGKYGSEAVALDELARDTGLLMVWAGGNERQDTGAAGGQPHYHFPDCTQSFTDLHDSESALQYDTLGLELAAKNTLVVGAAAHVMNDPASAADVEVLPFSGFGPLDDGRIKPELVASGAQIFSCVSSADDAYADFSGTSSSAAVATGTVALLAELYRSLNDGVDLRAEAIKAVLVHSAVAQDSRGAPTYAAGFGLLDARAAAELLQADAANRDARNVRLGVVASDATVELETASSVPAGTSLRATLVWLDPAGLANDGGIDDARPALINDLDLTLIAPDGTRFFPWSLAAQDPAAPATHEGPNHVDSVERVDVAAGDNASDGRWTLRVSANALDRAKPQVFALVASVALAPGTHPMLAAPRSAIVGMPASSTQAPVELALRNVGGGELGVSATSQAAWLSVVASSKSTPATLALSFDTSRLAAGDHFTTVALDSDDPTGPRAIGVMLHLSCAPDCTGRVCGPDPLCSESCGGCAAGETCTAAGQCAAWAAACPAADLGSQLGSELLSGSTQGAGNTRSGSCGGEDGPELAFSWTAPSAGTYRFGSDGSAIDTVLYVRQGCDGAELACNDDSDDATAALALTLAQGQTVTVFVDGKSVGGGDVHLSIEHASCPDADLGSALGEGLASNDLAGSVDRLHGSCGGDGTPEVALSWTAPAAGQYLLTGESTDDAAVVYVRDGDCEGTEVACNAVPAGPIELSLAKGQLVTIALDAAPNARITLSIADSAGACVGNCDGTPNHRGCFCDSACVDRDDCCSDACASCGHCCVPDCDGKACGPDGCGGSCGSCGEDSRCDQGECVPDPCASLPSGAACDDADACTSQDRCVGGRCSGTAIECDDGDPCTTERCDRSTGKCDITYVPGCCTIDVDCDDGDECTANRCVDGECSVEPGARCQDAGMRTPDAGAPDAGDERDRRASGCDCRVGAMTSKQGPSAIFAIALLLVALNRRRRARRAGVYSRRPS